MQQLCNVPVFLPPLEIFEVSHVTLTVLPTFWSVVGAVTVIPSSATTKETKRNTTKKDLSILFMI